MKNFYSKHRTIKLKKRLFCLFFSLCFLQLQVFSSEFYKQNSQKIPKLVIRFAEKNDCTNIKKDISFNRPLYGFKGYNVYTGNFIDDEDDGCIILYKYGITRFANDEECQQILGIGDKPFPLSPGEWWDYYWHFRRYGLKLP